MKELYSIILKNIKIDNDDYDHDNDHDHYPEDIFDINQFDYEKRFSPKIIYEIINFQFYQKWCEIIYFPFGKNVNYIREYLYREWERYGIDKHDLLSWMIRMRCVQGFEKILDTRSVDLVYDYLLHNHTFPQYIMFKKLLDTLCGVQIIDNYYVCVQDILRNDRDKHLQLWLKRVIINPKCLKLYMNVCCMHNSYRCAKILLSYHVDVNIDMFVTACEHVAVDVVKILINLGTDKCIYKNYKMLKTDCRHIKYRIGSRYSKFLVKYDKHYPYIYACTRSIYLVELFHEITDKRGIDAATRDLGQRVLSGELFLKK